MFIDFDNVEIGVKNTIGGQFDIGLILEAIKERGEIVTKIAYSDWKRAGDYSRLLTQHAIRMVQRNMTPGGDKNGADITMALDALEMAFTHDHINAFVIVGGDSDFISLVEKLKQYGRKVIVVGGRQFTSMTMQKNCHEFIAYENLVGRQHRGSGRSSERGGRPAAASASDISKALPLVKRALKVLSEREVAPQLGLLKSTLLQLDSTFSEREYGASSFRDFMEKVAQTGAVTLKNAGRSMMVESRDDGADATTVVATPHHEPEHAAPPPRGRRGGRARAAPDHRRDRPSSAARALSDAPASDEDDEESMPASPMTMQDGIRAVQQAFTQASPAPRWPMYVRQAKQFLKTGIEGFDERKYGFASVVDLLRAAGKEGVLRLERDRHGAVRVFPGREADGRTGAGRRVGSAASSVTAEVVDAGDGRRGAGRRAADPGCGDRRAACGDRRGRDARPEGRAQAQGRRAASESGESRDSRDGREGGEAEGAQDHPLEIRSRRQELIAHLDKPIVRRPLDAPHDGVDRIPGWPHVDQHLFILRAKRIDDVVRDLPRVLRHVRFDVDHHRAMRRRGARHRPRLVRCVRR